MKLKTKIISLAVAGIMALSAVSAFAAPSWKFAGYDLRAGAPYPILEYEVDENGIPTNNVRMNGFANKVEWKHAFYEAAYPHQGYNRLYLDDQPQNSYAPSATVADSEQDYRPVFWETVSPYAVYDVMYSRIPGVMDWTIQPDFVVFGNRNAAVAKQWVPYGFSAYETANGMLVDAFDFLNAIGAGRFERAQTFNDVVSSYINLWALDGTIQAPGFDINFAIPKIDQESLTGPAYSGGVESGTMTVKALNNIKANFASIANYNKDLLTNEIRYALDGDKYYDYEWVYGGYEKDGTYKMYEVLSIDGILMDGGACSRLVYNAASDSWGLVEARKPYIARYTGGEANPQIVWQQVWPDADYPLSTYMRKMVRSNAGELIPTDEYRYEDPSAQWVRVWPEEAYPFSVYERKMVKNLAGEWIWTDEYRPTGEYAKLLPSFILTPINVAKDEKVFVTADDETPKYDAANLMRNMKLVLTSDVLPRDFIIDRLIGDDYLFMGSNTYIFNGNKVPAFHNLLINNGVRF